MRERFKIKSGLQGSSDFRKVIAKKDCLKRNHECFVSSPIYKEYQEIVIEHKSLTPEIVVRRYTEVWYFGRWVGLKRFDKLSIEEFIRSNFKFQ